MSLKNCHAVPRFAVVLLLAVMLPTNAEKSLVADEGPGLKVGAKAPAIELKNQDGKLVKVSDLLKDGPVAVVFHRSADW